MVGVRSVCTSLRTSTMAQEPSMAKASMARAPVASEEPNPPSLKSVSRGQLMMPTPTRPMRTADQR
jgi:hypothetical protein